MSPEPLYVDYLKKQGINVVGLDYNPRGTKESSQIRARIEKLPFLDQSVDVILY